MSAAMNVEVDDDDDGGDDEEATTLLMLAMLRCGNEVVVGGAMNACAKEYIPMVMTSWKIG